MIQVNQYEIDDSAIVAEIQYHSAETHTQARQKACESLIISELIKQRARELNIKLDTSGTNEKGLNILIEKEVQIPVATEAECRAYYLNNPHKFKTSPLISGRHILIYAAPDDAQARSEALELAREIIRKLTGNMDLFDRFAKAYSRCPSAKTGGHLGQISAGQTVPEFERQLFNCEKGLASAPIESRYGVHVVDIDHKEEGRLLDFDMVKSRIEEYLNEKVKRKAIAQYIESLISNADIEGFDFSVSESPLMQ